MPNYNRPFGAEPILRSRVGGCAVAQTYTKLAAIATRVYPNDIVRLDPLGGIQPGGTPGTDLWLGIAITGGAASTLTEHSVIDDPEQTFMIQDDGAGGGLVAADMGLNCNFLLSAGNAIFDTSGHQLGAASKAVTATLDAKINAPINEPGNTFGQYCRVQAMFNKHQFAKGVAGV